MPGRELKLRTNILNATIDENSDFSNKQIKMYQISIKNLTDSWIDIDSVNLGNSPNSINILMGGKISSWIEACNLENKVSNYNMELFLGSVAASGAIVGAVSNSSTTSKVAYSISLGAIAASGVKEIIDSKGKAEFQSTFPDGHLFRHFIIPPNKVIQRWILIENPKEEDLEFIMTSKNKEVGSISFEIKKEAAYVPEPEDLSTPKR